MKKLLWISAALPLLASAGAAQAKDVPVAPAEYRTFNVYASRGLERQCAVVTNAKDLLARFTALGVNKPEAVLGLIDPPIDWQQSAMLLLYQPDPPPDVVPAVRALLKDVNREKFTLLFRYADPKETAPPPPPPASEPVRPQARPVLAATVTIKAYTVGTDDVRDRAGFRSPLLLVAVPRFGFVSEKSLVDCTQKL